MILRWRCTECREISNHGDLLTAPNPFDAKYEISGCPHCREIEKFEPICDEPGCDWAVSAGWKTADGGYRNTCYKHTNRTDA